MSVFDQIVSRNWDGLRAILSTERNREVARNHTYVYCGVFHLVCQLDPPLDILILLAETFPDEIHRIDNSDNSSNEETQQQNALHVAVMCGASPMVIRFLLAMNSSLACHTDSMGRTPLHWACDCYALENSNSSNSNSNENNLTADAKFLLTIKLLCHAAPMATDVEDVDGNTALYLAIDSGVHMKAIKLIQKVRRMYLRSQVAEDSSSVCSSSSEEDNNSNRMDGTISMKYRIHLNPLLLQRSMSVQTSPSSSLPSPHPPSLFKHVHVAGGSSPKSRNMKKENTSSSPSSLLMTNKKQTFDAAAALQLLTKTKTLDDTKQQQQQQQQQKQPLKPCAPLTSKIATCA